MTGRRTLCAALAGVLALVMLDAAAQKAPPPSRERAAQLMKDGNWQEAYDAYSRRVLDPADDPQKAPEDLANAVQCLRNLGKMSEFDDFVEQVVAAHPEEWRVLSAAAEQYRTTEHNGYIIAGKFERGGHRGGGKWMNCFERDRVRSLQLSEAAMSKLGAQEPAWAAAGFYRIFSRALLGQRGYSEAWRLQYLTDLTKLPDYDEGYYNYGGGGRGAPVNADGTPVYYSVPASWKEARNDGERWRWALSRMAAAGEDRQARRDLANFLNNQFGVRTMAAQPWMLRDTDDDTRKDESGTWALHTLREDETIARLASGVKRFTLPDEFNSIRIYQSLGATPGAYQDTALDALAQIFEDRRQYDRAAEYWRLGIAIADPNERRSKRLEQIVGNWGMFEAASTQPAGGKGASFEFRFRNGKRVSFEAREIDVAKLLGDLKGYLKSNPGQLDWQLVNIGDLGHRLVTKDQRQYLGAVAAEWALELQPRPMRFDRRITVQTPLTKAGAYLVTARMEDGNTSEIVLWVADTALVKKPMPEGTFVFVADAVTGAPVPGATLDFFGYRQEWVNNLVTRGGHHVVHTAQFAEKTDGNGIAVVKTENDHRHQWLITATTPEGRLAYHGFTGLWRAGYYDAQYNENKLYLITDRPVYRPQQTVKFKAWLTQAQYDREGNSPFAGQTLSVEICNPRGEKVLAKSYPADAFGGIDGELALDKEATLGVYSVQVVNHGGGSFRVEEYKKPEFEVTVDAPVEPVMLGDRITATVTAKYYFGAPVTEAKVKYKVLRHEHSARWYPRAYWDWFYEPGYWWFAYDYTWYPKWQEWGCFRPMRPWWGWRAEPPPEVVAEAEAAVGKDGTLKIDIDTSPAKAALGDQDHRYEITAEVTDQSRRTIVGTGSVLAARKPFKVFAWVDRGYYRTGDTVRASFDAHTLDNKPVQGRGELQLLRIAYGDGATPVESVAQRWDLDTDAEGRAQAQIAAPRPGQYRLSYKVTDAKNRTMEGGYVFCVIGEGFDGKGFRFNEIELVPNQREYKPGERVGVMVNTARAGATVLLFVRPANGAYLAPRVLRLAGNSLQQEIEVLKKDMPNFFIEAVTVADGKVHTETREIVVPPESRVVNVQVLPSAKEYKPGEQAKVRLKLTDIAGAPFIGSTVVALYDKSVEYVSGGSNVPEIKAFFWKWRRQHTPQTESSLGKGCANLVRPKEVGMSFLGVFGREVTEDVNLRYRGKGEMAMQRKNGEAFMFDGQVTAGMAVPAAAPMAAREMKAAVAGDGGGGGGEAPAAEVTVRTQFADTALWVAALTTKPDGTAEVDVKMPENLTTWKARVWAMGAGARVGEGAAEVVTTKKLILRLQAPRFFVEKDEVVLSANVHNYLKNKKRVRVELQVPSDRFGLIEPALSVSSDSRMHWSVQNVEIEPNGEARVDWRVRVTGAGEAYVRMKALTDEESDAMEMKFPVYVHGMLKTESFSGVIRPEADRAAFTITVPLERKPEQTRLEIRYSPTLAGAMVDALPYMLEYPYGCTEQTLNRFLPAAITQHTLLRMGLDLKDIRQKRTNLNAQEIGEDAERAKQWKRFKSEPVFDPDEMRDIVKAGINRLASMQCSDGGWGWFSGWGERSWPHTTAVVVHGLQVARANNVAIIPEMLERGVAWLKNYQAEQVTMLQNWDRDRDPRKRYADATDALVYMILVDEKIDNIDMREFLYRDRNELPVYAKCLFGLALHRAGDVEKRDMVRRNIEQFLVRDDENQTAYLRMPQNNWWWCWYGSEIEGMAAYLKLLAAVEPKGDTAPRLVKYLINNRKHATYWNSTRDTALCIEAFADYIRASGEDKPDMTLTVLVDGAPVKNVTINAANIFSFDNQALLLGDRLAAGAHRVELVRKGTGPVYFNAYLTNFTLEDPITRAGLEIKVNRKLYKLVRVDKTIKVEGVGGRALDQKVEKFERVELPDRGLLKSGDLVEVELEIESKNDYEYIVFEDMKPAGVEPVEVRSGYTSNEMGAYVEFRDERVVFFVRALARGKHSVSYRVRAEIPGLFSALPTRGSAMYAPELKANSDEVKVRIQD
jgi:uncharacterized protein YfaS (alpha-2-macroglobulin family)